MNILAYRGITPEVADDAFVAQGAVLVGKVAVHAQASVWFNATLRGDNEHISVGPRSNVQDGCVLHTDPGFPCVVGESATIGHNVVLHGCTIEDEATVGMGATVLNGARVGRGALVAAGALVLEGFDVPPMTLAAGVPAKVRRELTQEDLERFRKNAEGYVQKGREYQGETE